MDNSTPPGNPLGAAGECPPVEWEGTTYRLGHPTQAAKNRYCESLVDAEKAAIEAQKARGWLTEAKYDRKLDALGARVDRNEHRTGGALWAEYQAGDKFAVGLELFIWALFRENHPDMPAETVRAMYAGCPELLKLAVRRVLPGFFDWTAEGLKVPPERIAEAVAPIVARIEEALTTLGG